MEEKKLLVRAIMNIESLPKDKYTKKISLTNFINKLVYFLGTMLEKIIKQSAKSEKNIKTVLQVMELFYFMLANQEEK